MKRTFLALVLTLAAAVGAPAGAVTTRHLPCGAVVYLEMERFEESVGTLIACGPVVAIDAATFHDKVVPWVTIQTSVETATCSPNFGCSNGKRFVTAAVGDIVTVRSELHLDPSVWRCQGCKAVLTLLAL